MVNIRDLAIQKYKAGMLHKEIAKEFNDLGFLTTRGGPWKNTTIGLLIKGRIKRVMRKERASKTPMRDKASVLPVSKNHQYFNDVLESNLREETKKAILRGMIDWLI